MEEIWIQVQQEGLGEVWTPDSITIPLWQQTREGESCVARLVAGMQLIVKTKTRRFLAEL